MKVTKNILASAMATTLLATAIAPVAQAEVEVSASAAIASSYHWRGFDLGSGTPAFSGDITVSNAGFYASMWASSGDTAAGTEYDIILGYGGEAGDFSYDINYTSYIYPTGEFSDGEGVGDFAEIIGSVGYGPFSVFLHLNVAGAEAGEAGRYAFLDGDYSYYGVDFAQGAFSARLARHDEKVVNGAGEIVSSSETNPGVTGSATHLDLTWAHNDNLAFTFSTILASDLGGGEPDPKFVVSYSIPIE